MNKDKSKDLVRDLINKIYNSADITDDILDEIENDLKIISEYLRETRFSRELQVFVDSAKAQKNQIGKNNFKYLLLSNLEKRYKRLCFEE